MNRVIQDTPYDRSLSIIGVIEVDPCFGQSGGRISRRLGKAMCACKHPLGVNQCATTLIGTPDNDICRPWIFIFIYLGAQGDTRPAYMRLKKRRVIASNRSRAGKPLGFYVPDSRKIFRNPLYTAKFDYSGFVRCNRGMIR